VPVAALTTQPYVLIAGAWSQITTLGELVETAKASPGEVRFASTGLGTSSHLAVEKLTRDAPHEQPRLSGETDFFDARRAG
jgi:tripartite-type tricarboxylate transporter receptor subunit TctC